MAKIPQMVSSLSAIATKRPIWPLGSSSPAKRGLAVDESVQSQVEQYFIGRLASIAKDEKISADAIEAVSAITNYI